MATPSPMYATPVPVAAPAMGAPPAGAPPNPTAKKPMDPQVEGLVQFVAPKPEVMKMAVNEIGPGIQNAIAVLPRVGDSTETGSREWSSPWFAFWADPIICLWGYFCPCILASRTMSHVSGGSCEGHCLTMCATNCVCLGCFYFTGERERLRKKYDLKGSMLMDCLLSCCCGACLACQQAREVMIEDPTFKVPFALTSSRAAY